jgi:hypothetical protein
MKKSRLLDPRFIHGIYTLGMLWWAETSRVECLWWEDPETLGSMRNSGDEPEGTTDENFSFFDTRYCCRDLWLIDFCLQSSCRIPETGLGRWWPHVRGPNSCSSFGFVSRSMSWSLPVFFAKVVLLGGSLVLTQLSFWKECLPFGQKHKHCWTTKQNSLSALLSYLELTRPME